MWYDFTVARPLRIEFPGAVYHITSRGNARQTIFNDDADCIGFLEILCSTVKRYKWLLHAYCLMGNHYHLLVETPEGNLSKGMRQVNGIYTQYYNRRHKRSGHVMQGRYKSVLVDKDNYLLELCRYIVLNPVRAGLVKSPAKWPWSNYHGTTGYGKGVPCLATDWVLLQFGRERGEAVERYRGFVREGLRARSPWTELKGQALLGDERFIKKVERFLKRQEALKEIPREQRYATRPPLDDLLRSVADRRRGQRWRRDKAMRECHVRYGYTMKEIADRLGLHYTAVSRGIKRAEENLIM
jgi:REP element-mobilizing transposase RayT